jgi:hypothetical protein
MNANHCFVMSVAAVTINCLLLHHQGCGARTAQLSTQSASQLLVARTLMVP